MRIYRMTATFGKLEHETLTLEPGLNILQADNEWGKSTWCAFLIAMLYGLDTRAKTTKTSLADKERYAPWSGSPMSGSMEIRWKNRDITIERSTRGRVPMGAFRAYETATGLDVPELTAANCGQLLLGVEQSVFRRAGFIRLADMNVTQDEALRRRLNALVTTGDESGEGERLERGLRELKNKCRYNRTGLIPQTETERDALEEKLRELDTLENQTEKLKNRLDEVAQWTQTLQNHQAALQYTASQADAQRVAQAYSDWENAQAELQRMEQRCAKLPTQEEAERKCHQLREYQDQWNALRLEAELLPEAPEKPEAPGPFAALTVEAAREMVAEDTRRQKALLDRKPGLAAFLSAALCLLLGTGLALVLDAWLLAAGLVPGVILLALGLRSRRMHSRARGELAAKYGCADADRWQEMLEEYESKQAQYQRQMKHYHAARGDVDARMAALQTKRQSLCGAQSPEKVLALWQQVGKLWEEYHGARRESQRTKAHLEALQAMAKTAKRPAAEDTLTYTAEETARLLSDAGVEQHRLQNRLGQYQGRMEALGQRTVLEKRRSEISARLERLEEIYEAAELGLTTLAQAKRELQRRFAPRIAQRAQALLGELTAGRYRRLTLAEDLSLLAAAGEEDVLRDTLWRSEGTADQLYLALRLAVAEELTPHVPLILDDALVRFDDKRLRSALEILNRMSLERQVILFTCQSREKAIYEALREGQ